MKTIQALILAMALLAAPVAFAQHGNGRGNNRGEHRGAPNGQHNNRAERRTSPEDRRHFDGRRFDRGWEGDHFGRDHVFVIGEPVFVGAGFQFWYGGFWFGCVTPWPTFWGYTDEVYIDWGDGEYYLYNPADPGVRVAVVVY